MITESPTTKYFSAAVLQILAQSGHGAQADLARRAKMSVSYLNDLLSGRKAYWPDNVKEKVAQVCGYSVAELLEIGEHYIQEGVFWPHVKHVKDTAARSLERMARIFQLACKDTGMGNCTIIFTTVTLPAMLPKQAEAYQSGALSDAHLYADALAFCRASAGGKSTP